MLDYLKNNFSKVYWKPILLLFVVIVLLLGGNSIGCNGGGFATSFGADSIFYTQEEVIRSWKLKIILSWSYNRNLIQTNVANITQIQ